MGRLSTRTLLGTTTAVGCALAVSWTWPRQMDSWSRWRGDENRAAVESREEVALPGISWMKPAAARALVARFHLH
jgi:hypothetical protein